MNERDWLNTTLHSSDSFLSPTSTISTPTSRTCDDDVTIPNPVALSSASCSSALLANDGSDTYIDDGGSARLDVLPTSLGTVSSCRKLIDSRAFAR